MAQDHLKLEERFFDFDQFMNEMDQKPVRVKIFGQIEELPPSMPADMVLRILRLRKKGVENVPEEEVLLMAETLFGKERLERWCKKGLTLKGLEVLLEHVSRLYSTQPDQKDEDLRGGRGKKGHNRHSK